MHDKSLFNAGTSATIARVRALVFNRGYLELVKVYTIAQLPAIIFLIMLRTVQSSLAQQVLDGKWSWPALAGLMVVPVLAGLALICYCEVWSYAAVGRVVFGRARSAPVTTNEALAHVDLKAVGQIWLRALPLFLVFMLVKGTDFFPFHPAEQYEGLNHYLRQVFAYKGLIADGLSILLTALVILLTVEAADEKDIPAFAGKKSQAFLILVVMVGLIQVGSGLLTHHGPVMASRLYWMVIHFRNQVYHCLLTPAAAAVAAALYLEGDGPGIGEAESRGSDDGAQA